MARLFIVLMLICMAMAPRAFAQSEADIQRYVERQAIMVSMASDDGDRRRAALQSFLSEPDSYSAIAYKFAADALARDGDNEGALLWSYAGEIRWRTDIRALVAPQPDGAFDTGSVDMEPDAWRQGGAWDRPARAPISGPRRLAILDSAISLDARTPRNYPTALAVDGDRAVPGEWPAPAIIAAARRAAVEETRARVLASIKQEERFALTDSQIASGVQVEAAVALVPSAWRSRLRHRTSKAMPHECTANRPVLASTAGPPAFIVMCRTRDQHAPCAASKHASPILGASPCSLSFRWLRAADGKLLGEAPFPPDLTFLEHSASLNGRSYVLMSSRLAERRGARLLLGMGGDIVERAPGPPFQSAGRATSLMPSGLPPVLSVSRSGRFLTVGHSWNSAEVLDLATNDWAWTSQSASLVLVDERGNQSAIVYLDGGVCVGERCTGVVLHRRRLSDGAEAQMTLPFAISRTSGEFRAWAHGDDEVIIDLTPLSSDGDAAIVDIRDMRVVWSGKARAAPAPSRRAPTCGRPTFYRPGVGPLVFAMDAGSFDIPVKGAGIACAVSSDERILLIVEPPYLHFYDVEGR